MLVILYRENLQRLGMEGQEATIASGDHCGDDDTAEPRFGERAAPVDFSAVILPIYHLKESEAVVLCTDNADFLMYPNSPVEFGAISSIGRRSAAPGD